MTATPPLQSKLDDFETQKSISTDDIRFRLYAMRLGGFPLDFYVKKCKKCGGPVHYYNIRKNLRGDTPRYRCRDCGKYCIFDVNRNGHMRSEIVNEVLLSKALGDSNDKMVQRIMNNSKHEISIAAVYGIEKKCLKLLYSFEMFALQGLSIFPLERVWAMDTHYQDLPYKRVNGKLEKSGGHPHMYVAAVIDEESGYILSCCVSLQQDHHLAEKTLGLAIQRAGTLPKELKIDYDSALYIAAKALLPEERITRINKQEPGNYARNNIIEGMWSQFVKCFRKHECSYRKVETFELAANIWRFYRNYLNPYKESGKTPAESLGLRLPPEIKHNSFIGLLEFADALVDFVEESKDNENNSHLGL